MTQKQYETAALSISFVEAPVEESSKWIFI